MPSFVEHICRDIVDYLHAIEPAMSTRYFEDFSEFESSGDIRSVNLSDPSLNYTDFLRGYEENPDNVDKWTKIDLLQVTDDPKITHLELQQMNSTLNGKRLIYNL